MNDPEAIVAAPPSGAHRLVASAFVALFLAAAPAHAGIMADDGISGSAAEPSVASATDSADANAGAVYLSLSDDYADVPEPAPIASSGSESDGLTNG